MQRHSYRDVIGCDPRAEGAHEKARVHHVGWGRGGDMVSGGAHFQARGQPIAFVPSSRERVPPTPSPRERPMSLPIRRVVTGHDENGRAIVSIDESVKNVAQTRPGAEAAVIWTSEGFPVDNDGSADTS